MPVWIQNAKLFVSTKMLQLRQYCFILVKQYLTVHTGSILFSFLLTPEVLATTELWKPQSEDLIPYIRRILSFKSVTHIHFRYRVVQLWSLTEVAREMES